jgi:hypothetical protein
VLVSQIEHTPENPACGTALVTSAGPSLFSLTCRRSRKQEFVAMGSQQYARMLGLSRG